MVLVECTEIWKRIVFNHEMLIVAILGDGSEFSDVTLASEDDNSDVIVLKKL